MDPLSATASVIAIIQITNVILVGCYRLRDHIKDAKSEIARVISEIEDLAAVLTDLHDILQLSSSDIPKSAVLLAGELTDKSSPLAPMKAVLDELSQKLAPLSRPGLKSKFRWPFESKGIQRMIEILQSQKSTLQLALSSRQTRMLIKQSGDMADLNESLEHMGNRVESVVTIMGTQVVDNFNQQANKIKRGAILKWYKSSDPEQNHKLSRDRHDPDTGKWIFDNKEFLSWSTGDSQTLWLHGIPGAGKTVLCSTIINYMQKLSQDNEKIRVLYYYFDFADNTKQSLASFLKSIIFQLISAADTISGPALDLYEKCHDRQEPNMEELLGVLITEMANWERVCLLVDDLDECRQDERRLFFKHFFKSPLPMGLSVLITSRTEPDIEAALKNRVSHNISIQSSVIDDDVRAHVSNFISGDSTLQKWKPAIRQEILDGIVKGSRGMFRWAVCQLDTMKNCITPAMVRKELNSMPKTLDQVYDRILQGIPDPRQQYVKSAMNWLTFSARPLLLSELAEAVAIDPKIGRFDPDESRLMDENLILDLCGTLITISGKEHHRSSRDWLSEKVDRESPFWYSSSSPIEFQVVSLSHYSVKEYIISQRLQESALSFYFTSEVLANTFMAECCLIYLLDLHGGKICVPLEFKDYPLLQYSARFWMDHWELASQLTENSSLETLLQRLFDPLNLDGYVNWLNVWNPDSTALGNGRFTAYHQDINRSASLLPQPLYFASILGHFPLVHWLFEQGCNVHTREGYFGSGFAAAAFHGHVCLVNYFLEVGADPNLQGLKFGSVLQTAAAGGSHDVVQALLNSGADVNAEGGEYNTALIAAASLEHDTVVALLVKHGADLKIESRYHGSSLYQAASTGDTKMVITLLAAGADINHIGDANGTPLYAAAISGSVPLVQTLLRRGAEVNKGGFSEFGYPLVAAAEKGHVQIVRTLLRAGADPNISEGKGRVSALVAAIESRDMPTFRAIFDSGANPNTTERRYMNPFHAALWTGEFDMARILLQNGAEFEDKSFLYSIEIYQHDSYFMKKMLEMGPNINAHEGRGGSALHIAVRKATEKAVWSLLDKDPYVNAMSEDGSVLAVAISQKMTEIAHELIRRGANLNKRAKYGAPLDMACSRGDLESAKVLLEKGADINGGQGAAIHSACYSGNEAMIRFLAENGAELNSVSTSDRCTPLQCAVKNDKLSMVKLLLELGADVNGPSGEDGTAIHYALMSNNKSIVDFLLVNGAEVNDISPSTLFTALRVSRKDLLPILLEKGAGVKEVSWRSRALGYAFENDDDETVQLLLNHGATFVNAGTEVILHAVRKKPLADIKKLLDHGVDPNCHDQYQTPLGVATKEDRIDVVELLLEYGGDLAMNIEIDRGALAIAVDDGNFVMVEFLLSHGADPNLIREGYRYPLYDAARTGNMQMLELLLDHGADRKINDGEVFEVACWVGEKVIIRLLDDEMSQAQRQAYLDKCLQKAAYNNDLNLCSWLLENGANINHTGGKYGSPLQAAVSDEGVNGAAKVNNRRLIIDMFLGQGAKVNNPDCNGTLASALQVALRNLSSKSAAIFLDTGADVNSYGGDLHSPIQAAARYCPKLAERLLSLGADVNAVGGTYGTALHAAAYTHDLERIKLLLDHGADIKVIGGKYGSVIQAAAKENSVTNGGFTSERASVQAINLLYQHGASTTAQGGKYCTALQMAAKSGNLEAVKWLLAHGADPYVEGGKYGTALKAAVKKENYGVISYLEQHFPDCK